MTTGCGPGSSSLHLPDNNKNPTLSPIYSHSDIRISLVSCATSREIGKCQRERNQKGPGERRWHNTGLLYHLPKLPNLAVSSQPSLGQLIKGTSAQRPQGYDAEGRGLSSREAESSRELGWDARAEA